MKKRFTDTDKWEDPWFMDLPCKWKLFWIFLLDSVDNAGTWSPNMRLATFQIGEPMEASEALRIFSDRITVLPNGRWYVPKFVPFQYGELSEKSPPHRNVLSIMRQYGIREPLGYCKGSPTLQDKDKDKDKDSLSLGLVKVKKEEPKPKENPEKDESDPMPVFRAADGSRIPQGAKNVMDSLQARIAALRPSWRVPMTHAEMRTLMESAACLSGLDDKDWVTLREYLHARIPEGMPKYQPNSRLKFIEAAPDVWAYAFEWNRKYGNKQTDGTRKF